MDLPVRKVVIGLALFALSLGWSFGFAQDAAFANDWMTLLYARVKGESVTPPVAARIFAYTGITMNETLAALGEADSLEHKVRAGLGFPQTDPAQSYDTLTVMSAALYAVTTGLMKENSEMWQPFAISALETKRASSALHAQQIALRRQSVSHEVLSASLELGMGIGQVVLSWAGTDGFYEARDAMYASATELAAAHAEDAARWMSRGAGRTPIQPFWGQLTPLIAAPDACHVPLGIPFDLTPGSAFDAQLLEVYETSQTLSEDERDAAYFWDDEPVETGTIGGHFLMLGTMMVKRQALSLREAAAFYAVLGTALHDAFISAWWSKYEVMLVRPETLIRETIDPDWRPLLQTPNFPEYPSGHAVAGAAAAEVLTSFFGEVSFSDPYGVKNPRGGFAAYDQEAMTRSFRSFNEAALENAASRLYGGVHYRVSAENGVAQGECVARRVLDELAPSKRTVTGR